MRPTHPEMIYEGDTSPLEVSLSNTLGDPGAVTAFQLASEVSQRWRQGESPDLSCVLQSNPELLKYRSVVLELAHEEYCARVENGESVDVGEFASRYPPLQRSLMLLIEVRKLLEHDPFLQSLQAEVTWPAIKEEFLGFQLLEELGRGTFARVFLAHESALGNRLVALKVAHQATEEADTLGRLKHSNIVPVYSVKEDPGTGLSAVCMPYLGRATLCDVVDRVFVNQCPLRQASAVWDILEEVNQPSDGDVDSAAMPAIYRDSYVDCVAGWIAQLADALSFTHAQGICHRDLKPSNVLLSREGVPLLLDFNISTTGEGPSARLGGTVPYMAPEQLRFVAGAAADDTDIADPRSDIFSLGVIAYELLTGSLPFGTIPWAESLEEVAEKLLRLQQLGPLPLDDKNQHVDHGLAQIVERCLAFDPDDRPNSAEELAELLQKYRSPRQHAKRWITRHRYPLAALTCCLVVACTLAVGYLLTRTPFEIQQFHQAMVCLKAGQNNEAVEHLDEVIRLQPENPEALFARGLAMQRSGDFQQAVEDYRTLIRLNNDPRALACQGYCYAKLGFSTMSIYCNEQALEGGLSSPAIFHNLGWGYSRINRLSAAKRVLEKAIQADPDFGVAYYGLLVVRLNLMSRGVAPAADALQFAADVAEKAPPSPKLYFRLAEFHALLADRSEKARDLTLEYARKAVDLGQPPASLKATRAYSFLRGDPEFEALLAKPSRPQTVPEPEPVIAPF